MLRDEKAEVRLQALLLLKECGAEERKPHMESVVELLRDADANVLKQAVLLLKACGAKEGAAFISKLVGVLDAPWSRILFYHVVSNSSLNCT